LILNYLLEEVGATPFKDILTYDLDGTVHVAGKKLTSEQLIQLREGAVALENNWTYRVIKEQLAYEAVKYGIHSSLTTDMLLLSKSALWIQEQEKRLIKELSGENN
jgi:hypothetical protein